VRAAGLVPPAEGVVAAKERVKGVEAKEAELLLEAPRAQRALQREAEYPGAPAPGRAARPDQLAPPLRAVLKTPSSPVNRRRF